MSLPDVLVLGVMAAAVVSAIAWIIVKAMRCKSGCGGCACKADCKIK
jgi:hypothetical protein